MMSESYLGRGWSFPPQFDVDSLGVNMLEDEADIVSSLEILLGTRPGERAMLPQYGCNLDELLFENLSTRLKTLMADNIQSAILYFEPRIQVESVKLFQDLSNLGVVLIEIVYRVKVTNSRFNFVYPFYKLEGTDINLTTTVNLLPAEG
jgi:phage baseplate assembly protein W